MDHIGSLLGGAGEFVACYCCGRPFQACNMVAFHSHPEEGVCASCAAWLYSTSRPVLARRRIYHAAPWQLSAAWAASSEEAPSPAPRDRFLQTVGVKLAGTARCLRHKLAAPFRP